MYIYIYIGSVCHRRLLFLAQTGCLLYRVAEEVIFVGYTAPIRRDMR